MPQERKEWGNDTDKLLPMTEIKDFDLTTKLQDNDPHDQILNQYRVGQVSEQEIAQHFEKLIHFVIQKYRATYTSHILLDESDCYNLCLFCLFKAIKSHDSSRGKFTTYAVHSMLSGLVDEYKYNHRLKRTGKSISLDTFMVEENLADILYFKYACSEFLPEVLFKDMKRHVIDIIQGLSAKEQSKDILIDVFIHQKRPKDISKSYGITPQAVTYLKKWYTPHLQTELKRRQLV